MATYIVLADVDSQEFQNAQELATVWGEIRNDIEEMGGDLTDSYALLGGFDFLIEFELPQEDETDALEAALAIERHGLDTRSMRAVSTDRMGELVDDL